MHQLLELVPCILWILLNWMYLSKLLTIFHQIGKIICQKTLTGASLSIIEDIIELDISVFVQKLDSLLKQEQNVLV